MRQNTPSQEPEAKFETLDPAILEEVGQIFSVLSENIGNITDEEEEVAESKAATLILAAGENLKKILFPIGVEVIKFNNLGLQLSIPVAYANSQSNSIIRLLILSIAKHLLVIFKYNSKEEHLQIRQRRTRMMIVRIGTQVQHSYFLPVQILKTTPKWQPAPCQE